MIVNLQTSSTLGEELCTINARGRLADVILPFSMENLALSFKPKRVLGTPLYNVRSTFDRDDVSPYNY